MSKKRAFTMVELIFVIVILGILAAVAVPRLNASRADAEAAKLKTNLVTAVKDYRAYYATRGTFCHDAAKQGDCFAKVAEVTNVPFDSLDFHDQVGQFKINGEVCVEIAAANFSPGQEVMYLRLPNNSGCHDALKSDRYKEIRHLFVGNRFFCCGNEPSDYGDALLLNQEVSVYLKMNSNLVSYE